MGILLINYENVSENETFYFLEIMLFEFFKANYTFKRNVNIYNCLKYQTEDYIHVFLK